MSEGTLKKAIQSAKETKRQGNQIKDAQEAITQGLGLIEKSDFCMLGTNGEDGFPNIKGMMNLKHEGLKKIWFSTNTSSRRVQQLKKDNRACVYYVDGKEYKSYKTLNQKKCSGVKGPRYIIPWA
jgi:hypothetical protein